MPLLLHSAMQSSLAWRMRRCYYGVHYIWVYGGTICRRRRSESRGFLHSLRAGVVSPFHLFRDFQCLVWCVGLVAFWGGGRFLLFCVGFVGCLVFPFINSEMHKYVILSMTVTIVTMSAAMELKTWMTAYIPLRGTGSGKNALDVTSTTWNCGTDTLHP